MSSGLLVDMDTEIVERHLAALDEYRSPGVCPRVLKELSRMFAEPLPIIFMISWRMEGPPCLNQVHHVSSQCFIATGELWKNQLQGSHGFHPLMSMYDVSNIYCDLVDGSGPAPICKGGNENDQQSNICLED
uniref:Uncharacterized protein n=1 Tax=Sphaerodactylus townsendi TaxID=933632 RepID=A0ACB8EHB7_9SAUR